MHHPLGRVQELACWLTPELCLLVSCYGSPLCLKTVLTTDLQHQLLVLFLSSRELCSVSCGNSISTGRMGSIIDVSACPQPDGWGVLLGGGEWSLQPQNLRRKWTEGHSPKKNILTTNVSPQRVSRKYWLAIRDSGSDPQALPCISAIVSNYFCLFVVLPWFLFRQYPLCNLLSGFKQSSEWCYMTPKELLDVGGQAKGTKFIKSSTK